MSGKFKPILVGCVVVVAMTTAVGCSGSQVSAPSRVENTTPLQLHAPSSWVRLNTCNITVDRVTTIYDRDVQPPINRYGLVGSGPSTEAVIPAAGEHFVDVSVKVAYTDGRSAGRVAVWTERLLIDGKIIEPVEFGMGCSGTTGTVDARFSVPEDDRPMVLRVTPPAKVSSVPIDFDLR